MERYPKSGPTSAPIIISDMDLHYERAYISIRLYTDGSYKNIATVSSGIVVFTASEKDGFYGPVSDGVIYAEKINDTNSYNRPYVTGEISSIKATFQDIPAGTHAIVTVSKFGGNS